MEESKSEPKFEIIRNLNDIEKICSQFELKRDDIDILYNKYIEAIVWIDDNIKSLENETAVQLIEFMKHFVDVI